MQLGCRSGTRTKWNESRMQWNLQQTPWKPAPELPRKLHPLLLLCFLAVGSDPRESLYNLFVTHSCSLLCAWEQPKSLSGRVTKSSSVQRDKIAEAIKNTLEHLIQSQPRNPTFCLEVPRLSSSSRIFCRAVCSDLPTLFPVCSAKRAKQI